MDNSVRIHGLTRSVAHELAHETGRHDERRPHFHRGRVDNVDLLNRSMQTWLVDYNDHRPNNGGYMADLQLDQGARVGG